MRGEAQPETKGPEWLIDSKPDKTQKDKVSDVFFLNEGIPFRLPENKKHHHTAEQKPEKGEREGSNRHNSIFDDAEIESPDERNQKKHEKGIPQGYFFLPGIHFFSLRMRDDVLG